MDVYSKHSDFYNQPILLDVAQQEEPLRVINDFFGNNHLYEVRQMMWNIVATALSSTNHSFNEPHERGYLLCFYEQMELLIEACFLMSDKRLQRKKKKKILPKLITKS